MNIEKYDAMKAIYRDLDLDGQDDLDGYSNKFPRLEALSNSRQ
jgi:hypothetical protein